MLPTQPSGWRSPPWPLMGHLRGQSLQRGPPAAAYLADPQAWIKRRQQPVGCSMESKAPISLSSNKMTSIWERHSALMRRARSQCSESFPNREAKWNLHSILSLTSGQSKTICHCLGTRGHIHQSTSPTSPLHAHLVWVSKRRQGIQERWLSGWRLCPRRGQGIQHIHEH